MSEIKLITYTYRVVTNQILLELSHAQLEFDVLYTEIKSNQSEDFIPPLRILSCDIEVVTRPPLFRFPVNGREEIIQIGNVMSTYTSGIQYSKLNKSWY